MLFSLSCFSTFGQKQADLTKFVRNAAVANVAISDIDNLTQILRNRFVVIANDTTTEVHKNIQIFFEGYKISSDNREYNVYPKEINKKNVTIQYIDYATNYGWVGETKDSVFNSSTLIALIFIPAFDQVHKGQVINTICFKATLEIYSEGKLDSKKDYKRKEKIVALEMIELEK
ncbi:MAG: hypothetical protein ABI378_08975 [Chitinophagaceae bacterium]